jgi:hypothetical protein
MRRTFLFTVLVLLFSNLLLSAQETDDQVDQKRRLFISDFISTYEKAYEIEDTSYIRQMFSSDALILTETKELQKCGSEIIPQVSKKRPYKTLVENRKEYIARLSDILADNYKVRLSISGKRIVRHPKFREIYGVSFFQLWIDEDGENNLESQMPGYLFLMIDFRNNELSPIIHVRTWQPQSNISEVSDKYSLGDFKIYETKK